MRVNGGERGGVAGLAAALRPASTTAAAAGVAPRRGHPDLAHETKPKEQFGGKPNRKLGHRERRRSSMNTNHAAALPPPSEQLFKLSKSLRLNCSPVVSLAILKETRAKALAKHTHPFGRHSIAPKTISANAASASP